MFSGSAGVCNPKPQTLLLRSWIDVAWRPDTTRCRRKALSANNAKSQRLLETILRIWGFEFHDCQD